MEAMLLERKRELTSSALAASTTRLATAKATRNRLLEASSAFEEQRAAFKQDQDKVSRHMSQYRASKGALDAFEDRIQTAHCSRGHGRGQSGLQG